jgi:hypothetical protein
MPWPQGVHKTNVFLCVQMIAHLICHQQKELHGIGLYYQQLTSLAPFSAKRLGGTLIAPTHAATILG